MSNFNTMTKIADAAKKKSNNMKLIEGHAEGVISGHKVVCRVVPIRTNGRCTNMVTWYVDGKKSSKTKVAAL